MVGRSADTAPLLPDAEAGSSSRDAGPTAVTQEDAATADGPACCSSPPTLGPGPWAAFSVGLLAQLAAGTLYMYGAYGDDLKEALHLRQSSVEAVGYLGDAGVYLASPLAGTLQEAYGPRLCCGLAAAFLLSGYAAVASLVSARSGSLLAAGSAMFIAGMGSGLLYISTIASVVAAFPAHYRGRIVGPLVSLYGISALAYSTVYVNGFGPARVGSFLLFMACATAVSALAAAVVLPWGLHRPQPSAQQQMGEDKTLMLADDAGTVVPLAARTPSESVPTSAERAAGTGGGGSRGGLIEPLRKSLATLRLLVGAQVFWQAASLLFLTAGCGLLFINNVGQIARSVLGPAAPSWKVYLVGAISMANFGGRLLAGIGSDAAPFRRGWWLVLCTAMMAATYAAGAMATAWSPAGLLLMCVGIGSAYGLLWSVLPICVSEGLPAFGITWGWLVLAPAGGALAFNALAGYLYELAADGGRDCSGPECFRYSFALASVGCVGAALISLCFTPATRVGRAPAPALAH